MPGFNLKEAEQPLATGWDVVLIPSTPYTLSVDGVSTTILTENSTLEEVEAALNKTSLPVGLDIEGDPATAYKVIADTPAVLTGENATVTPVDITEPPGPTDEELKQGAINLAYSVLVRDHNGGPHQWPAERSTTEAAVAALRPYQTIDEAEAEIAIANQAEIAIANQAKQAKQANQAEQAKKSA